MDSVRRDSGEMVPYRGITNKRDLLPTEYALIDHLGLTRDEYFEFLEQCHYASTERKEGYELIPHVVNDPVTILVNIAIGIALTAVSALLAPKPSQQQQKERKNLQTADQNGRQRFTPYESFGSVQELAKLGSIIPLIYTSYGVRVNGKLLWSHLQSQGSSQQLRAIVLFGNGVTGIPDFDGIAIGDQLLKNYGESRMRAYYSEGYKNVKSERFGYGRLRKSDEYPETEEGSWAINLPDDPFLVKGDESKYETGNTSWLPGLSGTRNVSTNSEFGVFYPLSNGHAYQLPYELVLVIDGSGSDAKEDARSKISKINRPYKINASIVAAGKYIAPNGGNTRRVKVNKGDIITYRINSDTFSNDDYEPWGLTDVNSSINARRIEFDEKLQIGEVFQIGTTRAVVVDRPRDLWREGKRHDYHLKSIESGNIDLADTDAEIVQPTKVNALLRFLDGIVSNNRDCDLTEIGLKSTVWKQITSFSNVNSQPSDEKIKRYEEDGDSIQLGSMSKYISRYSFFRVRAKKAGADRWVTVTGSHLLCVRGNTPQAKYNALRITHPYGQHEFKFVPVPGSTVLENLGQTAYILQHDAELFRFSAGAYDLYFNATTFNLNIETLSNPEWIIGGAPSDSGKVVEISKTQVGFIPKDIEKSSGECAYAINPNEDRYYWRKLRKNNKKYVEVYWGDKKIKRKIYRDKTPNGYTKGGYTYTRGAERIPPRGSSYAYWEICRVKAQAIPNVSIASVKSEKLIGQSSGARSATVKVTTYKNRIGGVVGYAFAIDKDGSGYSNNEIAQVDGIQFNSKPVVFGIETSARTYNDSDKSLNPFDAVSDYYKYDEERSSHQDGAEHSIAYVNEIILADDAGAQYTKLSMAGIVLNSGFEFQSFSQISAYFKEGIKARRLSQGQSGNIGPVNTLPEIAYDLLTNTEYGMGQTVGEDFIDRQEMEQATNFCLANKFLWDGVITEQVAIRDFLYQNAAYCMLQFCCFSGQFFFKPSIPFHSNNRIFTGRYVFRDYNETRSRAIDISGLFSDGNMRGFEVTFLPPEQRQTFKAEVSYREEDINGFPTTKVISVRLKSRLEQGGDKPGGSSTDPAESFDMTAFCRSETHAIRFAKYALRVRSLVTHTVSFETTPEMAQGVIPGDFIRVCTEYSHFSRFDTGSVDSDGNVQSAGNLPKNKQIDVYQWKVGTTGVKAGKITINDDNKVQMATDRSLIFVRRNTSTRDRTYQVEAIEYGEEGYIKITASFAPSNDGKLEVLDWDDDDFIISE